MEPAENISTVKIQTGDKSKEKATLQTGLYQ